MEPAAEMEGMLHMSSQSRRENERSGREILLLFFFKFKRSRLLPRRSTGGRVTVLYLSTGFHPKARGRVKVGGWKSLNNPGGESDPVCGRANTFFFFQSDSDPKEPL